MIRLPYLEWRAAGDDFGKLGAGRFRRRAPGKKGGLLLAGMVARTSTRVFLRFLIAIGRCPAGRDQAIPNFAGWQLAPVPHFLNDGDIEKIVAACDGAARLRDRAVILFLVRLGLRGSEVANLEFDHIDWRNGRIAIMGGKSRREEWLPLPQEVGEALLAYLERGRPTLGAVDVHGSQIS